jgi:Family of unknown function (DUF5715)
MPRFLLPRSHTHQVLALRVSRPANHALHTVILLAYALSSPVLLSGTSLHSGKPNDKQGGSQHRGYRLWNPMFPGSHALLVQQNIELDRLQLPRMTDEYELVRYEMLGDLVPVSESDALKIAPDLPENRRYCRPWTRDFLRDLSQAYYAQFQSSLQVNSLVRTAEQQHRLRLHNRFAAPESGDTASTHLAGVAVDLSLRDMSQAQYEWIRSYLLPLREAGMVDPIEERQPVLHIVVFKSYVDRVGNVNADSEANEPTEGVPASFPGMP